MNKREHKSGDIYWHKHRYSILIEDPRSKNNLIPCWLSIEDKDSEGGFQLSTLNWENDMSIEENATYITNLDSRELSKAIDVLRKQSNEQK